MFMCLKFLYAAYIEMSLSKLNSDESPRSTANSGQSFLLTLSSVDWCGLKDDQCIPWAHISYDSGVGFVMIWFYFTNGKTDVNINLPVLNK